MGTNAEESLWSIKKRDSNKIYSDIPLSKIKTWIFEGRIEPNDYLTSPEIKKWVHAHSVKVFAPYFAPEIMGSEVISSEDMGFAWSSNDQEDEYALDMTPMIDVTFLLLIFFMITTTFSINQVKQVHVPSSSTAVTGKPEKITIAVFNENRIILHVGGAEQRVSMKELQEVLAEEVTRTKQQDILVAGDKELKYEFVVQLLDIISKAGIKNINLKLKKAK